MRPSASRGFVNTQSLVLPVAQAKPSSDPLNLSTSAATTTSTGTSSAASSTAASSTAASSSAATPSSSYPQTIIPEGAQSTAPKGAVQVAVLFKASMPWLWIVRQRETTAQIFTYLPRLLAAGIGMGADVVTTKELRAYTVDGTMRTLYVAYIPSAKRAQLGRALHEPKAAMSPPDVNDVEEELLEQIDPSFDVDDYATTRADDESDEMPATTRTVLVSSFSGIAGVALLSFSVWLMQRYNRRRTEQRRLERRNTIQSFSALSGSPASAPCQLPPAMRSSSYYVGDPHGSSITAFESRGMTGRCDVVSAPYLGSCPVAPDAPWHSASHLLHAEPGGSEAWSHAPYCYADLIPNVRPSESVPRTADHNDRLDNHT